VSIQPPQPLITADEFCARFGRRHAELVKGTVKESPVPFQRHGTICSRIDRQIGNFADAHDLGHVSSNDSWVRTGTNPDTVRGGDVCFFSYERLPRGPIPDGLLDVPPDLVVEVRSPSDLWTELFSKVGEYLAAGVRVVVILDPGSATASVYRADGEHVVFRSHEALTVPDVLPGFGVNVGFLFGLPTADDDDRRGSGLSAGPN